MINIPKMKFPKKYTEIIKKYKNKTPEEKAKIEDDFIKEINDKDSEFYSPMMANMNEHELRAMLRMMPSLIDTGDDNDELKNLKIWIGSISLLLEYCDYSA